MHIINYIIEIWDAKRTFGKYFVTIKGFPDYCVNLVNCTICHNVWGIHKFLAKLLSSEAYS